MAAIYAEIASDWARPIDPMSFAERANLLKHRGAAGIVTRTLPGFAISTFSCGHDDDAAFADQPWVDQDLIICFDGTIANQGQLLRDLNLPSYTKPIMLVLHLWRRFGHAIGEHLPGGFVLLVLDVKKRSITAIRDAMGIRSLYYRLDAQGLALASEPSALRTSQAINEAAVAHYFAFRAPSDSFFEGIMTLPAGAVLTSDASKLTITEMPLRMAPLQTKLSLGDAAQAYKQLLSQAIARQLPDGQSTAISLSGGLDSNVLLALALANHKGANLKALTWRINAVPDCDESNIASTHTQSTQVWHSVFEVDDAFPLSQPDLRHVSANWPMSNIYRELKTKLYQQARSLGIKRILNGHFADHVFYHPAEWATGVLSAGAYREFFSEYRYRFQQNWRLHQDPALRRYARRRLGMAISLYAQMPELTAHTQKLLQDLAQPFGSANGMNWRARQHEIAYAPYAQFEASGEAEFAESYGIQSASPYRDAELMQFMLSLPNHLTERRGISKYLVRHAMQGLMPEAIRLRPKSNSLQPFLDWALNGPAKASFLALINGPNASWQRYYDANAIQSYIEKPNRSDRESALLWMCVGYELWMQVVG